VQLSLALQDDALPSARAVRRGVVAALNRQGRGARIIRRTASPIVILVAWQLSAWLHIIDIRFAASPSIVATTFGHLIANGVLERNLLISLTRVAIGFSLGATAGFVLAVISGLFRLGEDVIDPPIQMLRTMPILALAPLFILWFGIGELPKVLIIALGAFYPIYLNTFAGIRGIDNKLIEAAQTLNLNRLGVIRHIIAGGVLPSLLVGIRYSLGISWLVLVVSEQLNASSGIGYLMTTAETFFETNIVFVGLMVYALLGLSTDLLVRFIERKVLTWRVSFSGA
jgi:sulfonate transport system permease protein